MSDRINRMIADRAIEALRAIMEETVLAGYPGGDRVQTLKNVREMRKAIDDLSNRLVDANARLTKVVREMDNHLLRFVNAGPKRIAIWRKLLRPEEKGDCK